MGAALCVRSTTSGSAHGTNLCLPGTRVEILDQIAEWIHEPEPTQRILLLTDVAGSGKSTLARTVAHRFASLERLAASFAFENEDHTLGNALRYMIMKKYVVVTLSSW